MDETSCQTLETILGEQLSNIAVKESGSITEPIYTNLLDIYCECNTIILKQKHAKLVKPSASILEFEEHLMRLDSEKFSKKIFNGCYWLVDDMYKFEQIGYTKEITSPQSNQSHSTLDSGKQASSSVPLPSGLRYLLCAECNLCPLGWFEPSTKESYLYVWLENK